MFMRIDRRFMAKCFGQMQELGIYPGQIPVLGLLAHKDGLSQREIAEKLHIKPPTVNVTVQRLEKAGFLYREADEKDQRISRIYMTEKGKQAKESGMKKVQDNEKILLDGFSDGVGGVQGKVPVELLRGLAGGGADEVLGLQLVGFVVHAGGPQGRPRSVHQIMIGDGHTVPPNQKSNRYYSLGSPGIGPLLLGQDQLQGVDRHLQHGVVRLEGREVLHPKAGCGQDLREPVVVGPYEMVDLIGHAHHHRHQGQVQQDAHQGVRCDVPDARQGEDHAGG